MKMRELSHLLNNVLPKPSGPHHPLGFIISPIMDILIGVEIQKRSVKMRSPKVLLIGSVITDIAIIIYLLTLIDEMGIGLVILLSALLLGATFFTYKIMSKI